MKIGEDAEKTCKFEVWMSSWLDECSLFASDRSVPKSKEKYSRLVSRTATFVNRLK